jgi:hypothetical protein
LEESLDETWNIIISNRHLKDIGIFRTIDAIDGEDNVAYMNNGLLVMKKQLMMRLMGRK